MVGPYEPPFRPIALGKIGLQSHIVMSSMHTGLEAHPERFAELVQFYASGLAAASASS